jgi:hypothetical protein
MIYIRLAGGLGNQLFQLAAGLEIQSKTSQRIVIYTKALFRYATQREPSSLSLIELPDNITVCTKETFVVKLLKYRIGRLLNLSFCINNNTYQEINKKQSFYLLDSSFQNVKYIKHGIDLLKTFVVNKIKKDKKIIQLFYEIIQTAPIDEFCALHIRRGDYTDKENQSVYPLYGEDYYTKGLKKIGNKIKTLVIFSDDKHIAFDFFKGYNIVRISDFNLTDYQEFQLLSLFKNIIIANSTYSFWGAICDLEKDKRKIAPTLWSWRADFQKSWPDNLLIEQFEVIDK